MAFTLSLLHPSATLPLLFLPSLTVWASLRVDPQSLLEQLKTSQHDKHRLMLLDNFEHVIPATTLLVELLEACPDLKLLVTSREVLRLRAEYQFAVPTPPRSQKP